MKIDKATETLDRDLRPLFEFLHRDYNKALELGIEALKRVKDMRTSPCTNADEILPGETK